MSKIWKKLLAVALTASISAGAAVAGTVAYLQDTDEDVNVMTLGNVDIEQIEEQRVDPAKNGTLTADDIESFKQGKPLLPYVDENLTDPQKDDWEDITFPNGKTNKLFIGDNAIDKFIAVSNTGKSDAYVRTIIALEAPTDKIDLAFNSTDWKMDKTASAVKITVDGVNYDLFVCYYKEVLAPKETTPYSLLQVLLDGTATNDDVAAYGDTYDVLALSQAVQTAGFDSAADALNAAFGEVTAENAAAWFEAIPEGFEVSTDAEFDAAIAAGETEIWLNPGTYTAPAAAQGKTLTINGTKDAVLEVVPAGQGEAGGQLDYAFDGSKVTFNGVTIKTNSQLYAGYARLSGTYNNCVIQNTYNLGTGDSAFYNCEFNITNEYLRVGGASTAVFDGCTFNTDGRAILVFQDGTNVAQTVTVKDCTFNATAAANTWNGIHVSAVSIDGANGKDIVNLDGTNTVDSDFNGLWQIKAGAANVTVNE